MSNEQTHSDQPTTSEILAEVERRRLDARSKASEEQRRVIVAVDRLVFWLCKHWLAVFNTAALIYVGLPVLAPVLMHGGAPGLGRIIYAIYKPLCHQLPHRSFFLFGPQIAYTLSELWALVGAEALGNPWSSRFVGNEVVGYKIALCQRDIAIYGMIFLVGVVYGILRRPWKVRSLPVWAYFAFGVAPIAIDGGYQWVSGALGFLVHNAPVAYESTPLKRLITGALFGLATVWLAYPYVQEAMDEFRATLHKRFGWE